MRNTYVNEMEQRIFWIDILCTVLAFVLSFYVRHFPWAGGGETLQLINHLMLLPLIIVLITSMLSYFGAYRTPVECSFATYGWSVIRAVLAAVLILLALLFLLKIQYVSRAVILLFASFELCILLVVRKMAVVSCQKMAKSGKKALQILVIGSRKRAIDLLHALKSQMAFGVEVVGFVDPDPARVGEEVEGIPVICTVENIHECFKNNVIDEVIIAVSRSLLQDAEPIVQACEEEGIKLRFMADLFDVQVARVSLSEIKAIPLLTMEPVARDSQQLIAKRILDLTLTIAALPILVPLFCLVAFAIKIESRGPVFFVQQRVGLRKHEFPMFKFRSMYEDAEERMKDLEHLNEASGPIFKITNDPRVTRIGKFIRRTSIDELPQLINVLRGEMSLVGPRPMSLRDVEKFDKGVQRKRFSVQPGLTCIWQVSGRSNLTFDQWLELDLQYIENWSFWLDIQLLLKTVPAVVFSKGAV